MGGKLRRGKLFSLVGNLLLGCINFPHVHVKQLADHRRLQADKLRLLQLSSQKLIQFVHGRKLSKELSVALFALGLNRLVWVVRQGPS